MIRLLRWFLGYVYFEAVGGFSERFLNLCKIRGIPLWNVSNNGVKVKAVTSIEGFQKLNIPCENSGMVLENIKEKGLKSLVNQHKSRFGLVLGLVFAVLFISFVSGFIWNVEIIEKEGVKLDNFTEILAEEGVKIGARKSKIDVLQVQESILNKCPQLSWISINIFGSKAQIEYTPIKKNVPQDDAKTPKNLVATKKGKIVLVEGYRGKNEVKEGDYVDKGDLLISGVTVNGDLSESFVHASGKIFALTENKERITYPLKSKLTLVNERKSIYEINIFGFGIPFSRRENGEYMSKNQINLQGNGTVLPFGINRYDNLSFSEKEVELKSPQARLLLLEKCVEYKREQYADVEFEKISYGFFGNNSEAGVDFLVECLENIACEGDVFVEEN